MQFTTLTLKIVSALALARVVAATPTPDVATKVVTIEEMKDWLANTDAELTFAGNAVNVTSLSALEPDEDTVVVYCTTLTSNGRFCGGRCTVYQGLNNCISAPDTNCISSTRNIATCTQRNCQSCRDLFPCSRPLDDNFCAAPGVVSFAACRFSFT
ncbi:hypothetical protein CPB84DRAFT_1040683 [Gymnopilus junonius]|uniref:Uncharacterized protein n=1 Tax=Gymnopilus junonius TaxID=109634 RepID=A0A9P5NNJ7_GYMJU|nr:hypothetical protein CPB84DRAFT_1040683 [Gymnopilus junonius]